MENYGDTTADDRNTAKDRKHSIWCYMRKGWTAYCRSFRKYGSKYNDIKWDKKPKGEIVQEGAITKTIIKY